MTCCSRPPSILLALLAGDFRLFPDCGRREAIAESPYPSSLLGGSCEEPYYEDLGKAGVRYRTPAARQSEPARLVFSLKPADVVREL